MLISNNRFNSLAQLAVLLTGLVFLPNLAMAVPTCKTDMTPYLHSFNVTGMGAAIVKHGQVQCTSAAGSAVDGNLSGWTLGGGATAGLRPSPTEAKKHAGSWSALLGAPTIEQAGDSYMYETVALPAGKATKLTFWYYPFSKNKIAYAWQEAQVQDASGKTLAHIFKACSNTRKWTEVSFDLTAYAGRTVRIYFNAHSNGPAGHPMTTPSGMYLDDVSVVSNGRQMIRNGGFETEQATAYTPETVQSIASVSKTVVATALLQLYEQGKFQLDDPINNYLPFQVAIPACPGTPITFRELLTHTSGIQDNYAVMNDLTVQGDSPVPLEALMRGYFAPGGAYYSALGNFYKSCPNTQYQYSNFGATLLGYLVQVLSGQGFNDYVTQHIFTPLGMTNTSFFYSGINPSTLAVPYSAENGDAFGLYGEADYPDGMMKTSVDQLARFLAMYMNGGSYNGQRILRPATVALMLSRQTSLDTSDVAQGLIWYETADFAGRNTWGHGGDDFGINTSMYFYPAAGEGVILFGNGEWNNTVDEAKPLMNALFAEADSY